MENKKCQMKNFKGNSGSLLFSSAGNALLIRDGQGTSVWSEKVASVINSELENWSSFSQASSRLILT
jgi:hypothetical protein